MIRIARAQTSHLANDPVIRIDEDARPNADGIRRLLKEYMRVREDKRFFLFSGTYGAGNGRYDPLNDHAVRTHWFAPLTEPGQPVELDDKLDMIRTFLADLNEIGAPQMEDSESHYSQGLRDFLQGKRLGRRPQRSCQVISGAGLIMSSNAVRLLPPFMNVSERTIWVDDHLKRCLHEAVGDLDREDLERVSDVKFEQDRYPFGIRQTEMDFAKNQYFDRLLRGCLFHSLITDRESNPTAYANLLDEIVRYRVTTEDDPKLSGKVRDDLEQQMTESCGQRYDAASACWQTEELKGTLICDWATKTCGSGDHKKELCKQVVGDAMRYMELVLRWPVFVRSIERLPFFGYEWLFDSGPQLASSQDLTPRPLVP